MTPLLKTLVTYGARGSRVRVYLEQGAVTRLVRVRWRVNGVRKHRSWPDTSANRLEAKAFALGLSEARREGVTKPRPKLTLRELWERYQEAEFPTLRPKSQERYLERWRKWERFLGRDFLAEDTTQENADQYRTARTELGIVINQVHEEVKMAKMVYAWGQRRRLLAINDLALYRFKIAKEDRRESPDEYRMEDFTRILAEFRPAEWAHWRPWAMLTLLGYQGVRTNSARHLQWADVDLEAGLLTWRAKYDKLGREWTQPIRERTREALLLAWDRRTGARHTGPWVFFSQDQRPAKHGKDPIYTHQALAYALTAAETRAHVPHIELRAMHGLRRMVVGEIMALTGDLMAAAAFIGDVDLRVVGTRYLKRRDDQLRAMAARMDAALPRRSNASATEIAEGGVTGLNPEPLVGFEPTTATIKDTRLSNTPAVDASESGLGSTANSTPLPAEFHPETSIQPQSEVRP